MEEIQLKKISEFVWQIPKEKAMKVPATIYASEKLLKKIHEDRTLWQARNVAMLKGILKSVYVMPDAHEGYGFPIGGVAAFDMDSGIISPGGIGYDINCSVRLLTTNITVEEFLKKRQEVVEKIFKNVPSGVGRGGKIKVNKDMLMEVMEKGAKWAVENGYGKIDDYKKTEENGHLPANPEYVSDKAIARGLPQLGSLGAGNHFLEIQRINKIFNEEIAKKFNLEPEYITIMIHCGSRGLGHQVASDYIKEMERTYGYEHLPDRELVNAPINSELGQRYLLAMGAAANFAFANKQMITHWVRESFEEIFGKVKIEVVYDVCHNIAKIEKHKIDGETLKVCVHRKGATRAFGPGNESLPEVYQAIGQPVLIPGSMGTASYVLVGTKKAEEISFASTAHGAGRVMSRHQALKEFRGEQVKNRLMQQSNIYVRSASWKGIAEEAPEVYKDIDEVARVSDAVGIAKRVVRLIPLAVIKG